MPVAQNSQSIPGGDMADPTNDNSHQLLLIVLMLTLETVFTLTYMQLSAPRTEGYVEGGAVHISRPRTLHYLNPQPQDIECAQLVPIEQPSKSMSCNRCSCDSELYQPLIGVKNAVYNKSNKWTAASGKGDRIIYVWLIILWNLCDGICLFKKINFKLNNCEVVIINGLCNNLSERISVNLVEFKFN